MNKTIWNWIKDLENSNWVSWGGGGHDKHGQLWKDRETIAYSVYMNIQKKKIHNLQPLPPSHQKLISYTVIHIRMLGMQMRIRQETNTDK